MPTIQVTQEVYQLLLKYAGILQSEKEKKVSINDAIKSLFELKERLIEEIIKDD